MPDNSAGNFIDELSNGDKAILGGSLVVFIAMFLPWYGASYAGISDSSNGFHRWGLLTLAAWLCVVLLWLARGPLKSSMNLPRWGIGDARLFMILGGAEILGAILFWIDGNASVGGVNVPGLSVGPSFGLFVCIVGGAATVYGGFLKQSEPEPTPAAGGNVTPPGGYGTPPPPPAAPPSYGTPPPPPPSAPPAGGSPAGEAPPPPAPPSAPPSA